MSWFAAHIVMFVKVTGKRQRRFPVWENIVLIEADSEARAFAKAEQRGHLDEGDDGGSFRWGGQPASWVFAGVRKLTLCDEQKDRPSDGTEVSYLEFEVDSEDSVAQLVAGHPVPMRYNEKFRDELAAEPAKPRQSRRKSSA